MTNTLSLARSVWGIAPDLPRVSLTILGVCLAWSWLRGCKRPT